MTAKPERIGGKTIVDGRYAHTSASQIRSFRQCPRIWYNDKILKLKQPASPAMLRGTGIHSAIEAYLKTKETEGEWQQYVFAAAPYLPTENFEAEKEFALNTFPGGPKWIGYIDILHLPKITDYKTTSDFKYAKTSEELSQDTQLNSYAKYAYEQGYEKEIELGHLYLLTKGKTPKAKYVSVKTDPTQVETVWSRDLETVKEICQVVEQLGTEKDRMEELTPNLDACNAYGGCFYRNRCGIGQISLSSIIKKPLAESQTVAKLEPKEKNMTSLSEKLKAKMAEQALLPVEEKPVEKKVEEVLGITPPDAPVEEVRVSDFKVETKVDTKKVKLKSLDRNKLRVYINCFPIKGKDKSEFVLLEDWLPPLAKEVAKNHGVGDWREISYISKAALTNMIKTKIDQLPEAVVVSEFSPGADSFLEVAIPLATEVIRGK